MNKINDNRLVIKPVENQKELQQVFHIRKEVFVKEQNVAYELEMDGFDDEAIHFIVYLKNHPVGCARIRTNKYFKLERIAIISKYRGLGIGSKLTKYLISYCINSINKKILMHSQKHVSEFYKKFGFVIIGEPFFEAGIEHVKMILEK